MTDTIILKPINQIYFQVTCTDSQAFELRARYEAYIENYKWNPKVRAKIWSGKISFFSVIEKQLPIGFLQDFIQHCKSFNYKYIIDCAPSELMNFITDDEYEGIKKDIFKESAFQLRDYQDLAFKTLITKKRGIIEYGTGSGKSMILYAVIKYLMNVCDNKILLIVPSVSLVQQMSSDFREYGWDGFFESCGLIFSGSEHYDTEKKLVVSTWQSLQNRPESFFNRFDAVLVDEVHGAKALVMQKILKLLSKAEYRIGTTGTLSNEKINTLTITGLLGPVVAKKKSSELIKEGILSPIKIVNCLLKYPEEMVVKSGEKYNEEVEKTIYYPNRNRALKYIIKNLDAKKNTLVLAHRIEHIKQITEYLKLSFPGRKVYEIYGGVDADEREKIRKLVNDEEGTIIVASFKTVGTGINIPKLHHIIMASSYKSKITVIQAIGRGLRTHESKSKMVLFDFVDDLRWKKKTGAIGYNNLYNHYLERKKHYKEQGFESTTIELFLDKLEP